MCVRAYAWDFGVTRARACVQRAYAYTRPLTAWKNDAIDKNENGRRRRRVRPEDVRRRRHRHYSTRLYTWSSSVVRAARRDDTRARGTVVDVHTYANERVKNARHALPPHVKRYRGTAGYRRRVGGFALHRVVESFLGSKKSNLFTAPVYRFVTSAFGGAYSKHGRVIVRARKQSIIQ